ncbi:MAG: hypothetical protein R3353_08330, partial [Salegentibacter mishustinae]|nr:hypothetical protein [Salegentibacter mishustinae]
MANQLIDLSQSGSLGANSENAFASLGYGVELSAEFCNGFDLQFKAQASGNAGLSANITEFFEAIVEIEAGVEVGIRIAAQLSPNLRDEIGLIASFQAYLKAYIRARLELQLTLEKIIQNVSGNSSAVQLRIFKKFLEQIEIGVGVEANAQIALTAAAEIVCRGRIFEDENTKAGFDFRLNAEAAFMFGAGFDFFSMLRFENITEFFRDSKNILLEEIEEHIDDRQLLEKHQKEFFFMIWNTVLDTVIDASTSKIENKSKYFYETISNFSYNFLFDQINNIYREFIKDQTRELMNWLDLNEDTYNEDINKILIWLETIEKEWDNKTSIFDLLPHLTLLFQAIERLGYDKTPSLSNIISHLYFIGYLIDNSNRTNWKNIPEFVQQNFEDVTGRRILEISSETDCFEYLEKSCIEDFLKMETTLIENRMRFFVDQLSSQGISVSEFIKLTISLRDEDSKKKLLGIGIDLVDHLLSEEILEFLENDLKSELQQNGNYGDEIIQVIIENLYQSYKTIFIGMFKKVFVEGGTKADYENLSMLAGKFLINIISKNFSFLVNELLNYSARNITTSIAQCESKIRGGSLDQMVNKLQNRAVDRLELVIPYELPDDLSISVVDKMLEATNDFLLDILRIARTSMGTETWTEARIDQISGGLEYVIFNPDSNHLNFQTLTEDQIKIKIDELTKCDFLPDFSKNELLELIETLQTIGLKQLKAFLFEMPLALAEYLLKLLKILFVDFIIEILDALWEKLKELL